MNLAARRAARDRHRQNPRDARQIFYRLAEEKAAQLIHALYVIFRAPEQQT